MKKLIAIIFVVGLGFIGYTYASTPLSGDTKGGVHIEVVDQSEEIVIDEYFEFEEEVSLFDLLQDHFTIGCADATYEVDLSCSYTQMGGHMILRIDDVETDWYNSFLEITIDGAYSQYGADKIMLQDNTTYRLTYTSLGGDE